MSGLADFAALKSAVDDLAGLDLSPTQRDLLINEGYLKLATQSEFIRANIELVGVAGQEAYSLPFTGSVVNTPVYRVLEVWVDDERFLPSDEQTARRFQKGYLALRSPGIFWLSFNASGVESLSLHPTVADGADIVVLAVNRPGALTNDTDVPAVPMEFRRGIVDYVAAIALGSVEDAADLRAFHQQEFDRQVAELRALRNMKAGSGPRQTRIVGVHI